jgi:hypothetical protein
LVEEYDDEVEEQKPLEYLEVIRGNSQVGSGDEC